MCPEVVHAESGRGGEREREASEREGEGGSDTDL